MTPQLRGHAAMLAFSMLVAGSFALGSLSANEIAPAALNAVRFWIAAGLLSAVVLATGALRQGNLVSPWRFPLLALFLTTYFVLMFEGLKTAAPVSAAAVFTLTPLIAGAFGWLLLRQIMTPRMALALAIGAAGALWVIFRADIGALLRFEVGRGEAIFFWGVVAHAIYTPLVRKLNRGETALVSACGVLISGAVILTVWGWRDLVVTDWGQLPGIVWVTIFYTAIFASAATFVLIQYAALRLPSAKVMAYTYLVPSWVILWDLALGQSPPPLLVAVGVLLTLTALLMLLRED